MIERATIDAYRVGRDVFPVHIYGSVLAAAAKANARGGGTVLITPGTWDAPTTRTGALSALLPVYPGVSYVGMGKDCVVRVPAGLTAASDYRLFAPFDGGAADTDDVSFRNFTIDGNGANNLVLGSTGGNVRRAYAIQVARGRNIRVEGMTFDNMPGRNVVVIDGTNPAVLRCKDIWIVGNRFRNLGGAIVGNELQDDHSAIYCQADGAHVNRNTLWAADAAWNPSATATRVVSALEIHGTHNEVEGNLAYNFTNGANIVAGYHENRGTRFRHNQFWNCTNQGAQLWSLFALRDLLIEGNLFHLDTSYNVGVAGLYQSTSASVTLNAVENLKVIGNDILTDDITARSQHVHGIQLCAVDGGVVARNTIRNWQSNGVYLTPAATTSLGISDLGIENNDIENVGYNTNVTLLWAVAVINGSATVTQVFRDIRIDGNRIRKDAAAGAMRGIRLEGGGSIWDVGVGGGNRFKNIADPTALIQQFSTTNFRGINIEPRFRSVGPTTDPDRGQIVTNQDAFWTTTTTLGQSALKVATSTGGQQEATWATGTVYVAGQWIILSSGKILECTVGGTSHASTEPTPATLGQVVTDNTVTWAYRAAAAATIKPASRVGYDEGFITLANNSTTPSVSRGENFFASNSLGTSVTDFTNGGNGQQIVIVATNGNTTLVHGATIKLKGAVNAALGAANNTLTLVRDNSGVWYEIARNF